MRAHSAGHESASVLQREKKSGHVLPIFSKKYTKPFPFKKALPNLLFILNIIFLEKLAAIVSKIDGFAEFYNRSCLEKFNGALRQVSCKTFTQYSKEYPWLQSR